MSATTFCIALMAAQIAPSSGADSTAWISPPVTMSAVPIVSSTKPQKIPACISPGPRILEHLRLDEGVLDQADHARRQVRERAGRAGRREDPQVAGHGQREERRPRPRRSGRRADRPGRRRTARTSARVSLGWPRDAVIVRPGERLEGVIEHRLDGLERLQGALRAARQVDDQAPARGRRRRRATGPASGVFARPAARIASASPGPRSRSRPASPAA